MGSVDENNTYMKRAVFMHKRDLYVSIHKETWERTLTPPLH